MLRILRVIGIVVFAIMVGFSANSLKSMHEDGTLFERYNSGRRAYTALLGASVLVLGALGFFEVTHYRRLANRRRYGHSRRHDRKATPDESLDTQNIYSAPKTVDEWHGRSVRFSTPGHARRFDLTLLWLGLLKVFCFALPVVYFGVAVYQFLYGDRSGFDYVVFMALFLFLALFAGVTAVGVVKKRIWGMSMGYILAICNLLIFPVGTAVGLFLLMGLVGSMAIFTRPSKGRKRSGKRKTHRRMPASAV